MGLNVGEKAPAFTGINQDGQKLSLESFKGQKIVLYFYPKDHTPGCTQQAQDFRDLLKDFEAKNTVVIGISKDSVKRHTSFREKFALNFELIADESTEICQLYDVLKEKSMFGKKYMGIVRTTFLIDEEGIIQKIWPKVKVPGHVEEILNSL